MAGVHFGILLIYLNILRTSFSSNDYEPVRMCNDDYETLGRCFVSVDQQLDWHAADTYCQNSLLPTPTPNGIERYGHLAAIEDATSQSLVAGEAARLGWDSTWINGCLKDRFWFWQKHWGVLAYQGCWQDDPSNPDLPIVLPVDANTKPSDCLDMCTERGRGDPNHAHYVLGIQKDASGNLVCRCGAEWKQKHGRSYSGSCDGVCPGSGITMTGGVIDKYCGGNGHQLIYYVDGEQYHTFAPAAVRSYDHCIVMNHDHNYQWTEHNCHDPQPFICQHDISEYYCKPLKSYEWANGVCITLEMTPKSFYDAQGVCAKYNADLLKVENSDVHDAIKDLLDGNHMFYIALTDDEWIFSHHKLIFRYYNWGTSQPAQGPGQDCFKIKSTDNYRWYNIDCDTPLPFMCMVDIFMEDEQDTTMSAIDGTTKATGEEMSTTAPGMKAGGVSDELLIGIGAGAGGAVVIVVVILLCICCCLRRGQQERKRQRQGRNQHTTNRALPRPPANVQHRGAPVSNPSYEPDLHMGHNVKGGQTFNDPHYMQPESDRETYHEYADLERKNYDYLEPVHSKRKY